MHAARISSQLEMSMRRSMNGLGSFPGEISRMATDERHAEGLMAQEPQGKATSSASPFKPNSESHLD
jgi:hypothetical protein